MGELTAGVRVRVKFNDNSPNGFSWYVGTIKGQKDAKKYTVEYDDDDEVSPKEFLPGFLDRKDLKANVSTPFCS